MKYWILFSQTLSQFSTYRLRVLSSIAYNFVTPLIVALALSQARSVGGISVSSLWSYYLVVLLMLPFLNSQVQNELDTLTFSGEINNFLMKPMNLYLWLFVKEIAEKSISLILFLPIVVIILSIKGTPLVGPVDWLAVAVSSVICLTLSYNFSFLMGLLCFWFDEFWTISNIKTVLVLLLGGIALPYSFFPDSIKGFLKLSIFPYLVNWPARIMNNGLQENEMVIAIFWLVFTTILIRLLWGLSVNKYSFTAS